MSTTAKQKPVWLAPLGLLAVAILMVFALIAAMTGEWEVTVLDLTLVAIFAGPKILGR